MAFLTFAGSKENNCFSLYVGSSKSTNQGGLITSDTALLSNSTSLLSNDGGFDSCDFYSGPSDATIMAFGESYETCGNIADASFDSASMGYSGSVETCGAVASSDCGSGFSLSC